MTVPLLLEPTLALRVTCSPDTLDWMRFLAEKPWVLAAGIAGAGLALLLLLRGSAVPRQKAARSRPTAGVARAAAASTEESKPTSGPSAACSTPSGPRPLAPITEPVVPAVEPEPEGVPLGGDLGVSVQQSYGRSGGITMRVQFGGVGSNLKRTHLAGGGTENFRQEPSKLRLTWVAPGEPCQVAGLRLPGGMLYLGAGGAGELPCLLDDSLSVTHDQPDFAGSSMGYWPSYDRVTPSCRAAFLRWLADGRSTPGTYIGYVFLFFYGLERRLLVDSATHGPVVAEEAPAIAGEVRRLASLYGESRSFRRYAHSFLGFLSATTSSSSVWAAGQLGELHQPQEWLWLRAAIGRAVATTGVIPTELAFAWVVSDPEVQLRTPAERCAAEFHLLFQHRFRARFGDGIPVEVGKRTLRAAYHPATAGLPHQNVKTELPDVTAMVGPRRQVLALAEECMVNLEPLSRLLGRSPAARGTVAAMALLPTELAIVPTSGPVAELKQRLDGVVGGEGRVALASLLVGVVDRSEGDKPSKKDLATVLGVMNQLGYAMEPDQRFGGPLPTWDTEVVVFRSGVDAPEVPSGDYAAAALLLQLAALVVAADDEVTPAERERLETHIVTGLELSHGERTRLSAHLRWLLRQAPGWNGMQKRIEALSQPQRQSIGNFLVQVAYSDGRVDPAEVKVLTKAFKVLGLDPATVHEELHAASMAQSPPADGPVVVRQGTPEQVTAIPRRPSTSADVEAGTKQLDMRLVAARLQETASVSALLASVFTEDVVSPPVSLGTIGVPGSGRSIGGLDGPHSALLVQLGTKPSWLRADYEAIAEELGLLPDGALDRLNDLALDVCEAPLAEGDDPIDVDMNVHKELVK